MTACPHCPHRPHRPASIEALDAHVAAVHAERPCNVCDGIGYFGNPADGISCEACRGSGRVMAVAIAKEEPPAAVHGKGVFALVRAEPSEAMCAEALDEHAQRSTDPEENGEMMAVHASTWRAMLAASPPPTDAEIDELCTMYAPDSDHWGPKRDKFSWGKWPEIMERHRNNDRTRMRAFVAAITGAKP